MDKDNAGEVTGGGEVMAVGETEGRPVKFGKRKLIVIIAAAVVVLGGGAGAYLTGMVGGADTEVAADDGHGGKAAPQPVFYPLPEMIVTINTGERKSTFLKLRLNIEVGSAPETKKIDPLMPRVTDVCQVFLRDLRLEDLQGSAGTARLRSELLRRISLALAPVTVKDVLIAEMMIN
ncbi:MAG: flagellar basal body-associated FliL family protein [Hyphomicrobiales bacterium]